MYNLLKNFLIQICVRLSDFILQRNELRNCFERKESWSFPDVIPAKNNKEYSDLLKQIHNKDSNPHWSRMIKCDARAVVYSATALSCLFRFTASTYRASGQTLDFGWKFRRNYSPFTETLSHFGHTPSLRINYDSF